MSRIKRVVKEIKGKTVLHFGFADHDHFYRKMNNNTFLHDHVVKNAQFTVGIDTDKNQVELLKNYYSNLYTNINDVPKLDYDIILLGEIIEHIGNPVHFLRDIKHRFPESKLIVTVPNAFMLKNFYYALFGKEVINQDHRFWFTPFTIKKVLEDAGYNSSYEMVESFSKGLFFSFIFWIFPMLKSNIYLTAKKQ